MITKRASIASRSKDLFGKAVIPAAIISGLALKNIITHISREPKQRRMLDSIINDPQFKNIDKNTLTDWYATILHFAPSVADDRQTLVNLLRQISTFGSIDMQTVKLLTEIEKNHVSSDKDLTHWLDWVM